MTKMLSQLLGAHEPGFRLGLRQLEHASGGTGEDIRLTSDIMRGRRDALRELGLDPADTTSRELYGALMQRVKQDNAVFETLIGVEDDSAVMQRVVRLVQSLNTSKQVFGLKPAAAKRILRKHPPKKALKHLGYRSIESVLKHEAAALLFAAAQIAETAQWHKSVLVEYKKLKPGDFEQRAVQLLAPDNEKWQKLSRSYVLHHKHNVLVFRELGAIVLLPMPLQSAHVSAAPLAATLLVLQAINDIKASSTYIKLHLVRPDFGLIVSGVARNEPVTQAEVAGAALPWKLVHQYFARHPEAYNADIFEPHVQPEDLQWQAAEDVLAELHPRFAFWQTVGHIGHFEGGHTVSLNLIDSVLNFCNMLPFEQRVVRYARGRLWHELMLRYMRQSGIEQVMHEQLGGELINGIEGMR